MTLFWKNTVPVLCGAVVCAAVITWQVHQHNANVRNLAEAARVCRASAEQGNAGAEFALGRMFYYGNGVTQDYSEAVRWYRRAEEQRNAEGEYGLGYMYYVGLGVPQDYALAFKWYQNAADQGDAKGEVNLGNMYYHGLGVTKDFNKSALWYRKAADQGYASGQYGLGYLYYYGRGLPQDRAEADRLYRMAAAQGDEYAQRALGLRKTGWRALCDLRHPFLLLAFLGSLTLSLGSFLSGKNLRNRGERAAFLAGMSGLAYVALSLYGLSAIGNSRPSLATNAFAFAKEFFAGVSIAMLFPIVWPTGTKRVLKIFGSLFVGLNLSLFSVQMYATLNHRATNSVFTSHLFYALNGLPVGCILTSVILLGLAKKKKDNDQTEALKSQHIG